MVKNQCMAPLNYIRCVFAVLYSTYILIDPHSKSCVNLCNYTIVVLYRSSNVYQMCTCTHMMSLHVKFNIPGLVSFKGTYKKISPTYSLSPCICTYYMTYVERNSNIISSTSSLEKNIHTHTHTHTHTHRS